MCVAIFFVCIRFEWVRE